MKRLLAIVPFLALLYVNPGAAHAVPRLPCTGTLTEHTGGCEVLTFKYKDGYVPTGAYDVASFPQTLFSTDGSTPACGWQQDLVQNTAVLPPNGILTSPTYFSDNGWLVDSAHGGTVACVPVVTTTTTTTVPKTTTTTTVPHPTTTVPHTAPPAAPPAEAVPVEPNFTG